MATAQRVNADQSSAKLLQTFKVGTLYVARLRPAQRVGHPKANADEREMLFELDSHKQRVVKHQKDQSFEKGSGFCHRFTVGAEGTRTN